MEDVDTDLYALDGNPRTVEKALDQMQFYQHWRRRRPSQDKAVREVAEDDSQTVESRRDTDTVSRETQEMKRRISQVEQALKKRRRTQVKPENCEIQDL